MVYFLDCEFTDLPWTGRSELMWIGLVDHTGAREFSVICADYNPNWCAPFVREHVLPHMDETVPRLPRTKVAAAVLDFVGPRPEFWAWFPSVSDIQFLANAGDPVELHARYADWDYQLLCGLFDQRPADWPPHCQDLHALADQKKARRPVNPRAHDPLADARWNRLVWLNAQATEPS